MRTVFALLIGFVFMLNLAGVGYAGHKDEKGTVKGTITKMEASEYTVTVKDDKGKETKVNVKDAGGLKVGDSVVVKDGKIAPAVKPKTGGY
jgi:hypothetical protein